MQTAAVFHFKKAKISANANERLMARSQSIFAIRAS